MVELESTVFHKTTAALSMRAEEGVESMVAAISLKCFVVVPCARQDAPLFVSVDVDSKAAFARASGYLKAWNHITHSGKAVLKRGDAKLEWATR